MKTYLLVLVLICNHVLAQESKYDSLILNGSEVIPIQIKNDFPEFYSVLNRETLSNKDIVKIYYGDYYLKSLSRVILSKGIIFIDKSYVLSKESKYDYSHAWNFLLTTAHLRVNKEFKDKADNFSLAKNRYILALEKAKEIQSCNILKTGLESIFYSSKNATDRNRKDAALELINSDEYKKLVALSTEKGCKPKIISENPILNNESKKVETNSQVVPQKEDNADSQTKVTEEEVMKNIKIVNDDFANKIFYFSKKTPDDHFDQDRFFIHLYKDIKGRPLLYWHVYRNSDYSSVNSYMNVEKILIKAENETLQLIPKKIVGNGTKNYHASSEFNYEKNVFDFIKKLSDSKETKVRLHGNGYFHDFDISNRERKAIKDVLQLYDFLKNKK